ncbi:hypothetical protein MAPG_01509 [Magnaporthiopsis poae ATCC 64411]|uniref:Uncharacterized protein n=1 Tax=Magnaporthiopsis poae (strain ATCC 64411 / 73-15) TaxID=644358 RepID=A0A0C4DNW2_MAGP6|nr:hypothetical protein MAPG_01509 [Magnaporthiopsis poae ATCC 64411]
MQTTAARTRHTPRPLGLQTAPRRRLDEDLLEAAAVAFLKITRPFLGPGRMLLLCSPCTPPASSTEAKTREPCCRLLAPPAASLRDDALDRLQLGACWWRRNGSDVAVARPDPSNET